MYPAETQSSVESTPTMRSRLGVVAAGIPLAVGVGAAVAAVVGALFVGGALAQQPTAVADEAPGRGVGAPSVESKLDGLQLPTLDFDE
jgi:hypothetical protein